MRLSEMIVDRNTGEVLARAGVTTKAEEEAVEAYLDSLFEAMEGGDDEIAELHDKECRKIASTNSPAEFLPLDEEIMAGQMCPACGRFKRIIRMAAVAPLPEGEHDPGELAWCPCGCIWSLPKDSGKDAIVGAWVYAGDASTYRGYWEEVGHAVLLADFYVEGGES